MNLPIKILSQKGELDTNSPTVIMLCGQGSSGKTSFWVEYLSEKIVISFDAVMMTLPKISNYTSGIELFNDLIKQISSLKLELDIVLDFAHDTVMARAASLDCIQNPDLFNFLIIHINPDFNTLIKNDKRRKGTTSFSQEHINWLKEMNDLFVRPTIEEFEKYNFKSVTIAEYQQIN